MATQTLLKSLFNYEPQNGGLYWKSDKGAYKCRGKRYGYLEKCGYRKGTIRDASLREHRLVWIWHNGDIPAGLDIDHKNNRGPKDDNRIENLRVATKAQNRQNIIGKSTKEYKGVFRNSKNTYAAYCRSKYLGSFRHPIDAALAYNQEAIKQFGEFACLNEIK